MAITFYPLKLFIRKRSIVLPTIFALLLNLAAWLWLLFGASHRSQDAVLHYTILFGVDQVGGFGALYTAPIIGLIILLINLLVAWLLYSYDTFIAVLIMVATDFIELMIFGTAAVLVFLNG